MLSVEELNNSGRSAQPTMPTLGEDFPEYPIVRPDLIRLTKACNMTGDLGYAPLETIEQRAAFINQGRTRQDSLETDNYNQLNALRIPLLAEEERFKAKRVLLQNSLGHDHAYDDGPMINDEYDEYADDVDDDSREASLGEHLPGEDEDGVMQDDQGDNSMRDEIENILDTDIFSYESED